MDPEVHLTRALNSARRAHKPTYTALRALIGGRPDGRRMEWASSFAKRKLVSRKNWGYYEFPILKEIEADGRPAYRTYTIGCPSTLLAEASLLNMMSKENAFSVTRNVYSYLWPNSERSGQNFQFYQYGYAKRNSEIRQLLVDNPNAVAWISDIRQFYPSIDWDLLKPNIDHRIRNVASPFLRESLSNFVAGIRGDSRVGIPVGPDFSHVLGNIALDQVDAQLAAIFGRRYFRYVDDIVIVCDPSETKLIQELVFDVLWRSNLELHDGKTDKVAAATWINECPEFDGGYPKDTFESLVQDLSVYLVFHPDSFPALVELFEVEGVSLPFERLVAQSKYDRFAKFILGAFRRRHFWNTIGLYLSREIRFVDRAKTIRASLLNDLQSLQDSEGIQRGMRRRWFVQRTRYCLNRLLYLFPRQEAESLERMVPYGIEFIDYRILLRAIYSGDVTPLLRYPGRLISAYCELASTGQKSKIELKGIGRLSGEDWAISESLATLALHFGNDINTRIREFRFPGGRILHEICDRIDISQEEITSMSYLDEIEVLMRGLTKDQLQELSRTRFSTGESVGLDGLFLAGDYGMN